MRYIATTLIEYLKESVQLNTEFYRWFNGSKVVDSNNKPLVVYHGSMTNFRVFKPSKSKGTHNEPDQIEGIYFTDNKDGAEYFALNGDSRFLKTVYLSMKNPYYTDNYNELKTNLNTNTLGDIKNILEEMKYDGLIMERGFYAGGLYKLYLAFNPNQVKSVDNDGSYDIDDDDIYS